MVVKGDQEKIKTLIKDTITLLCRNGLTFKNEFSIEALIGITLDKDDVFLVNINEIIRTELGEKLAASNQQTEEGASSEEAEAWDDASGDDTSQIINSPSRKRRRKRKQSADAEASNASFPEDLSSHSEPPSKKESTSIHKNIKHENDEDSNDLVFVKQEVDNDWNSRTFLDHSEADGAPQQQDIMQGSLLPTSTQGINTVAGDGTPRSGTSANSSSQNMQHGRQGTRIINGSAVSASSWSDHQPLDYTTRHNSPSMTRRRNHTDIQERSDHEDLSQFMASMDSPQNTNCVAFIGAQKSPKTIKQCNLCNKTFTSQYGYQTHLKMHQGIHPYKCDVCGKGMASKTNLDEHMRHHTGQLLQCEWCMKGFITSRAYKSHKVSCAGVYASNA